MAQGQLADAGRLGLADGAHRAGQHREVVGADGDPAAVDGADARHHAVGGEVPPLGLQRRVHRVGQLTQLDERAGVEEEVEPLPDGQLAHAPLPLDLLLAAHGQRLRLPPLQVVDQGLPVVQVGLLGHWCTIRRRSRSGSASSRGTSDRFAAVRRTIDRDMDLAPLGHVASSRAGL